MNEHVIKTENLKAGYDGRIIIDDLNITIPDGKVSVILGANGCGKSTLLKTCARLLKPEGGSVLLDGKELCKYPSKALARTLGLLPQSPTVPDGIRVTDLVSRGRFPYQKMMQGMSDADFKAVSEALSIMGIESLADKCVDELSGGQRQRVWIALALAQETDILFLDEPTTYLDIAYQIEILELLVELNRKKKTTIVMVLHDINEAARYADHIFAMKNGKLVAEGAPKDILTEDLINEIYGMRCKVIEDPVYGTPYIIPIGKQAEQR